MFEEIMGPLDENTGKAFLDIYYGYYSQAYQEFRKRVTEATTKAAETGLDPELPDREAVYTEVREAAYKKLVDVLNPDQLEKFRTWWEEKCHPNRR